MSQEKTEKATPKRRRDARKEGEVVKSLELTNAVSLGAVLLALKALVPRTAGSMAEFMRSSLLIADINKPLDVSVFADVFLGAVMPLMLAALIVGMAANYMQVGFVFSLKRIAPKFSKINPIQGAKRVFSKETLFSGLKAVLKLGIVGLLAYGSIRDAIPESADFMERGVLRSMNSTLDMAVGIGTKILIAMMAVSIVDYVFEWFQYEKKIRMTKQEIKDEMKHTEGDPLIKSNIRQKQRQMARMRMMQSVPLADAVIVNPTHYAVALKYETGKSKAPKVTAKGKGYVALKIKEIAREHDVYIAENPPLARTLYKQVEIGGLIPREQFRAVAEILAYVYKMKQKVRGEQ
mgnify:CR=1 FL=1